MEVKALGQLTGVERSQAIHYLKATSFKVALLLNFGTDSLQYERIVLNFNAGEDPQISQIYAD